jgi:hypothetical protein
LGPTGQEIFFLPHAAEKIWAGLVPLAPIHLDLARSLFLEESVNQIIDL